MCIYSLLNNTNQSIMYGLFDCRAKTGIIVKNLIALTYDATIGDLTSLEELVSLDSTVQWQ